MFARLVLFCAALLTLTGCFELKERVTIKPDGSGSVRTHMVMSLSTLIDLSMMGDPELTREEAAAAVISEQEASLPSFDEVEVGPGQSFEGGKVGFEGEDLVLDLTIGFSSLEAAAAPMPGEDGEPGSPLVRLPFTAKGKKLVFEGSPYLEMEQLQDEESMAMLQMMGADSRFIYEIEAPGWTVKKHDAPEQEGDVLRWTFGLAEVQQQPEVNVLLKK